MLSLSSPASEFKKRLRPFMTKDEIWAEWVDFRLPDGDGFGKRDDLWNDLESAGYNCDFDAVDIMAKIRQHGGEARVQDLRDCTNRFRQPGGTELLRRKLKEMVKAGLLSERIEVAGNGKKVEYYSVVNATLDNSCDNDD